MSIPDKLTIAHVHRSYPEKRNFLNFKDASTQYIQIADTFKLLCHLSWKLSNRIHPILLNLFFELPAKNKYDVLHLFNGVNLSNSPWVTTFETRLPRLGMVPRWLYTVAANRLANPSCIGIIALSDCTKQIQVNFIETEYPALSIKICPKISVLHPPQDILLDNFSIKPNYKKRIIFTFVGNQFFSKGGREIIKAFLSKKIKNKNFKLHIISSLEPDVYASNTTQCDVNSLKIELSNLPEHIVYHGTLPNKKVIKILKQSHVALLPTYADSYGYFVLEAQACGCPVISTDIRALPEINNMDCGWVISTPKDADGNGIISTDSERSLFSRCVYKGLEKYLINIWENPNSIKAKGLAAINRIRQNHDPVRHSIALKNIYLNYLKIGL